MAVSTDVVINQVDLLYMFAGMHRKKLAKNMKVLCSLSHDMELQAVQDFIMLFFTIVKSNAKVFSA